MTANELAAKIDGREYGYDIFSDVKAEAKRDGLVIVYGMSDDLMEFEGAINDEADVYCGEEIAVTPDGIFEGPNCECGKFACPYYREAIKNVKKIKALWCETEYAAWSYKTDIPHSTFQIMEDGEVYCIGIVFSVEDLE